MTFSKAYDIIKSSKEGNRGWCFLLYILFSFRIEGRLGTLALGYIKNGGLIIRVEVDEIIKEYMQVHRDLHMVDVIVLQAIEKRLEEIFDYCDNHNLEIFMIMDYDFDLRFIVTKRKSRYIRLNDGEINLFLSWNDICSIDGEKHFLKNLDSLLLRIKAIDGVDGYIRNTLKDKTHKDEAPPDIPIQIPLDDDFF